jgi:hypothetical protein
MRNTRRRLTRRLLILLLAPAALWALVLVLVPTAWARARLVNRLSEASGKAVHIGALRLGPLGGLWVQDVTIAEPAAATNPWLRVKKLRVDVGLLDLLVGSREPTKVEATGVDLRIHRRRNGSFEVDDLIPAPRGNSRSGAGACRLEIQIRRGRLTVIDEPNATRLELTELDGKATWDLRRTVISRMRGRLSGGRVELAGQVDCLPGTAFEGQMRAKGDGVDIGKAVLAYVIPGLARGSSGVHGRLECNMDFRCQGCTCGEVYRSLEGQGAVSVAPIQLDVSRIVADRRPALVPPAAARVGSVHSEFSVDGGRLTIEQLAIRVGRVPLVVGGGTRCQKPRRRSLASYLLSSVPPNRPASSPADVNRGGLSQ